MESLKSNHEEMAHPDIGKLVGAIPKEEGDEGEEEANHLSAPPKPESNAPPKKYTEPALTKVPTKNIGKPKDKVLYPPPVDVEEGEKEEKVEEAGAAADEEKKEEKTDDEELPEDGAKKMMLDVSNASSSEGFDFSAGLVATEENADNVSSDAELSAIEKEEDVKEKELESEDETQKERKEKYDESAVVLNSDEDNSSEASPKEEDEEKEKEEDISSSEAEAEPIPAKKMKLPTVSDSEIDAFVKDGTLPAEEEKKEEKVIAPVDPENDDVLDLKRAGMGDELGFDFAEGLKPATTTTTTTMETMMETEEAEVATAELTEETEETMPAEKQKKKRLLKNKKERRRNPPKARTRTRTK